MPWWCRGTGTCRRGSSVPSGISCFARSSPRCGIDHAARIHRFRAVLGFFLWFAQPFIHSPFGSHTRSSGQPAFLRRRAHRAPTRPDKFVAAAQIAQRVDLLDLLRLAAARPKHVRPCRATSSPSPAPPCPCPSSRCWPAPISRSTLGFSRRFSASVLNRPVSRVLAIALGLRHVSAAIEKM